MVGLYVHRARSTRLSASPSHLAPGVDASENDSLYNAQQEIPPGELTCRVWMIEAGVHRLRRFRYSLIVAGLFGGWLCAGLGAADADPPSARDVVDSQIKNALAVLRDAKLTHAQKREKIGQIADQHTDYETLSRLTLGRYWRDLSPDQRAVFVEAFRKHLSNL